MTKILEKEVLEKLKAATESGETESQNGKKNKESEYLVIETAEGLHAVVRCLKSGQWLYGTQIDKSEIDRYL
jgi:hypothetical protein